jgi:hypothetical protein
MTFSLFDPEAGITFLRNVEKCSSRTQRRLPEDLKLLNLKVDSHRISQRPVRLQETTQDENIPWNTYILSL